jgi:hypothetical protein
VDLGVPPFSAVLGIDAHRRGERAWIAVSGGPAHMDGQAVPAHVVRYDATPDGGWAPCLLQEAFKRIGTIADIDGDDAPDLVSAWTCGYCTSEYKVWVGR